jgi:hypothetical protein
MSSTKKSKAAKSTESIAARLALVVKSGKYHLGYKSALKQMRSGKGLSDSVTLRLGLEPEAEKVPMLTFSSFSMALASQTGAHRRQLPTSTQIRDRVLRHVVKDDRAPLCRNKCCSWHRCGQTFPRWVRVNLSINMS